MTFKEKIVRLRKLKGLTQDQFASAVGVSRQAVYKWESGQSYPEVPKMLEIKLLFGVSIDDLLDDNFEVALPEKKKRVRISKEAKKKIEAEVRREEELVVVTPPAIEKEEAVVAAPTIEEVKAEVKPEVKEEAKAVDVAAEEKKTEPEKKGFFARIFGRK